MREAVRYESAVHRFRSGAMVGPVSFTVSPGEIVALVGHNGSGKTTVLRMGLGLVPVHQGAVKVRGVPVTVGRLPERCAGMIENPSFLNGLNASKNLELCSAGDNERLQRIPELLSLVGLGDHNRRVREYSLGMRQRLSVARALLVDGDVMLLDEPANGLDPEGVGWFHALIRRLADEGRAVLLASHLIHELAPIADRTIFMSSGAADSEPVDDKAPRQ